MNTQQLCNFDQLPEGVRRSCIRLTIQWQLTVCMNLNRDTSRVIDRKGRVWTWTRFGHKDWRLNKECHY